MTSMMGMMMVMMMVKALVMRVVMMKMQPCSMKQAVLGMHYRFACCKDQENSCAQ